MLFTNLSSVTVFLISLPLNFEPGWYPWPSGKFLTLRPANANLPPCQMVFSNTLQFAPPPTTRSISVLSTNTFFHMSLFLHLSAVRPSDHGASSFRQFSVLGMQCLIGTVNWSRPL